MCDISTTQARRAVSSQTMKYQVQERLFHQLLHLHIDFSIEDENGNRPYSIDGAAGKLRQALELKDASGNVRTIIGQNMISFGNTMHIEDASGHAIAKVRPAFFSPIKHRYEIDLADGSRLEAVGDFMDRDWELRASDERVIGRISRQWAWKGEAYGVEVLPGGDDALVISIAICMDHIYDEQAAERQMNQMNQMNQGGPGLTFNL
jgi:uncharacterized protein YxjI